MCENKAMLPLDVVAMLAKNDDFMQVIGYLMVVYTQFYFNSIIFIKLHPLTEA